MCAAVDGCERPVIPVAALDPPTNELPPAVLWEAAPMTPTPGDMRIMELLPWGLLFVGGPPTPPRMEFVTTPGAPWAPAEETPKPIWRLFIAPPCPAMSPAPFIGLGRPSWFVARNEFGAWFTPPPGRKLPNWFGEVTFPPRAFAVLFVLSEFGLPLPSLGFICAKSVCVLFYALPYFYLFYFPQTI